MNGWHIRAAELLDANGDTQKALDCLRDMPVHEQPVDMIQKLEAKLKQKR